MCMRVVDKKPNTNSYGRKGREKKETVHKCLWQRKKEQTTNACGKERKTRSDRSPRNLQVAHRIGSGRNVLFLVELRQTEPFGWRTPLGEETAIPVVCFFIVGSEICFHKYRKHRLTFYIFIGHCTASCS